MHESSVTRNIVHALQFIAAEHQSPRVVSVRLLLGPLCGFSPASLREHFAHDARGTVVEGARVEVAEAGDEHSLGPLSSDVLLESLELEAAGS